MQNRPLIIGYWQLRGKGHILRMILQYLHIPYQQIHEQKQIAHLAHNLPFLKDGDKTIFDLMPCVIYIAKKYGREEILGKNIKDQAIVDMYHWDIQYLFKKLICTTFWRLSEEEKWAFQEKILKDNIEPILTKFQKVISPKSGWYLQYLSAVDFFILELCQYVEVIFPGKIQSYPKFIQIYKNVKMIPEIEELEKNPKIMEMCFLPQEMCSKLKSTQNAP